jgi:ribosomal protein L16/L10AE
LRYRHFAHAAEAIRHAIKKLPPKVLSGKSREVNDKRYNATQIHAL